MDVNDVRAQLEAIAQVADDSEDAHFKADALWHDVLQAIANETATPSAKELSAEALKVDDIPFDAWYA